MNVRKAKIKKIDAAEFNALCEAESYRELGVAAEGGIGIYNEKRIHRILKHSLCDDEDCFEVPVGRYVADVLSGGVTCEIQCGGFAPLLPKLTYYINETDLCVRIIVPIIAKRRLIRADRETGEILRVRNSPKRQGVYDALARLYPIRELLTEERISVTIALIEAEEYRYSERMRYRKKGAYDSELFPICLIEALTLEKLEDYAALLPRELCVDSFSAADAAKVLPLKGRALYSALNTLSAIGVLKRTKEGRAVRFSYERR